MTERKKPVNGAFYRHFKGNIYQVNMLAKDCESGQEVVVYQGMYPPYQCWVRELGEFMSEVDSDKYPNTRQKYRFEEIQAEDLKQSVGQNISQATVLDNETDMTEGEFLKALKSGQPERYLSDKMTESEIAMRGVMELLDAETFREKRQIFIGLKQYLDKHMLSNIAVALDIVLEEGNQEQQYESVLKCLETFEHYEGGRLR